MRADVEQALQLIHSNEYSSVERALGLLQNTVFSFSMKVCGHPQDAEDTMQDVLLKSLPYLPKFENAHALSVWLYKVARNRCLMNRRGNKFSRKVNLSLEELMPDGRELQQLIDTSNPSPESSVLENETADRLHQAILKVPPQYRFVLVLHDMEGLATAEVGKVTGLREGTVRVRLHRARLFLRRELSRTASQVKPPAKQATKLSKPKRCRDLFAALSDYMDGLVDESMCERMRKHLDDCKPCEGFLTTLEDVVKQCQSYEANRTPENAAKLRRELLQRYEEAKRNLTTPTASTGIKKAAAI
jgi:RNA polymerase sigma-70 factor, ECF subfamily